MKPLDNLALQQVERRTKKLRELSDELKVQPGWIAYIRRAMCMTLADLAQRVSLSTASVQQMEKRESARKITLESLEKLARAMDCELVYGFVPRQEISATLNEQALRKASELIQSADVHMTLEDQRVTENLRDRVERIAAELLEKGDIW